MSVAHEKARHMTAAHIPHVRIRTFLCTITRTHNSLYMQKMSVAHEEARQRAATHTHDLQQQLAQAQAHNNTQQQVLSLHI